MPLGPRQDVMSGDAPVRGSRNAAVTIVEFADYQYLTASKCILS